MMNKKIASEVAVGIILLAVLIVGSAFWLQSKKVSNLTAIPLTSQQDKAMENVQRNIQVNNMPQQNQSSLTAYQKIEINNPQLKFSFEAPNYWNVEKRNSGEKQMTLNEKKDFLADVFNGDSEYADYTREDFKKMSEKEIEKFFPIRVIASVNDGDRVSYSDFAWSQVDFILISDEESLKSINDIKSFSSGCISAFSNKEIGKNIFQNIKISGITGSSFVFPADIDENGVVRPTKSCTGGQDIYIKIPNIDKSLEIKKQAMGNDQFEKDFQHLIQTLKIEK